ncbi:sigma-70 family RNA polymerase sigma factor [Elstera litoralis]|nr:sigma-70 family RNA polymerase sigma factor [Elstera litoralis]
MAAAQAGDAAAYRRLLTEILPFVRALIIRQVGRADEDAAQEALLSLHLVRHTYDPARPFKPWLAAIVRHRLLDELRRIKRRSAKETTVDDFDVTSNRLVTNSDQEAVDEVQALRHALDQLPEAQRQAIVLLKLQDKSLAEAALEMGTNIGALKVSVHRALKRLKGLMGGE